MLQKLKMLAGNGIAIELTKTFTQKDAELIKKKFEDKLNENYASVNLLIKVNTGAVLNLVKFKAFLEGALWGFLHSDKLGRCAIVAPFELITSLINIESKVISLKEAPFEEKYFEQDHLEHAIKFLKLNQNPF